MAGCARRLLRTEPHTGAFLRTNPEMSVYSSMVRIRFFLVFTLYCSV